MVCLLELLNPKSMDKIKNAVQALTDLSDYYNKNLQGYYWLSDATKPVVVDKSHPLDSTEIEEYLREDSLPFVIEAHFYCASDHCSLQIKNVDGQCYIRKIDLTDLPEAQLEQRRYMTHDIKDKENNYRYYQVIEAWEEIEDPLLDDLPTLRPAWTAFKGFTST